MNDDALRDALRAADPVAALPRLDDGGRIALLERASGRPVRPARRPQLLLLGAAAVAVLGALIVLVPRGSAVPTGPTGPTGPTVTLLAAGADPSAQCAPLDAFALPALRQSDLAFSGTVTEASSGTATIVPDRIYRGRATGLVRLRTDSGGGPALDGPDLRRGEHVLVAAGGGRVAGCGLSAADSPELRRYYDAAFR